MTRGISLSAMLEWISAYDPAILGSFYGQRGILMARRCYHRLERWGA